MSTWETIGTVASSFVMMESVAWATHKFLMHGFLWALHKDHHKRDHDHVLERNDSFFLLFALPSMLLFLIGSMRGLDTPWLWVGLGVLLYGIAYFLVHEVFIHQRIKGMRTSQKSYFIALRRAHKIHHKHLGKEDGECFGMLIVPFKYYRDAWRTRTRRYRKGHEAVHTH